MGRPSAEQDVPVHLQDEPWLGCQCLQLPAAPSLDRFLILSVGFTRRTYNDHGFGSQWQTAFLYLCGLRIALKCVLMFVVSFNDVGLYRLALSRIALAVNHAHEVLNW